MSFLPLPVSCSSDRPLLFCIPHAGASASVYRNWVTRAPSWLEICAIDLPGRGRLSNEESAKSLEDLAERISEAISPFTNRPYAIFGHSMGALLAYEVARLLSSTRHVLPSRLLVSGALPPFLPRQMRAVGHLPDEELIDHLRELQGMPDELLRDRGVMKWVLPIVRSDFQMVEAYRLVEPHLLHVPVTVLSGKQDRTTPKANMHLWRQTTASSFSWREYPGGHFFISNPLVLQDIWEDMAGLRAHIVERTMVVGGKNA